LSPSIFEGEAARKHPFFLKDGRKKIKKKKLSPALEETKGEERNPTEKRGRKKRKGEKEKREERKRERVCVSTRSSLCCREDIAAAKDERNAFDLDGSGPQPAELTHSSHQFRKNTQVLKGRHLNNNNPHQPKRRTSIFH
jgi:hypothetical protein